MADITSILRGLPHFVALHSATAEEIKNAESKLDLRFSDEYCTYLKKFGVASAGGHELTGICNSPRLNVIDVTKNERANNPDVPKDWYVIEQANIDDIVIWQSATGEIYQTAPNSESMKICDSIAEYIVI